jgi:hypothetical protein
MDSIYIREKNFINTRIKELKSFIKRNEETIERLKGGNITSFEIKQIEKNTNINEEFLREIELLNKKIIDISNGIYDSQFKKDMDDSAQKVKKNAQNDLKNKATKDEKKKNENVFIQKSFAINSKKDSFNIQKETDKYFSMCESIPEYITKKLLNMPENKGYIWKGMWCFGKLPPCHGEPLIMFEKLYNSDILRIHEIDDEYNCIYEKKGKDKKYLISKEPRSDAIKEYRKLYSGNVFL